MSRSAATMNRDSSQRTRAAIEATRGGGPISFVISSPGVKRDGMNLRSDGWRLEDYRDSGSPVLWNHEYSRPPIGRADKVYRAGDKLKADVIFDRDDPFAVLVESKIRNGFLRACSVGWDFMDRDGRPLNHRRMSTDYLQRSAYYRLNEVSVVPVGADPSAVAELDRAARAWRAPTVQAEAHRLRWAVIHDLWDEGYDPEVVFAALPELYGPAGTINVQQARSMLGIGFDDFLPPTRTDEALASAGRVLRGRGFRPADYPRLHNESVGVPWVTTSWRR